MPGYMKESWNFTNHPFQTLSRKTSPLLNIFLDTMQNENFFGDYIWNPNETYEVVFYQWLKYLSSAILPFTIQQVIKTKQNTGNWLGERQIESFFGFTNANKEVTESELTKKIYQKFQEQTGGDFRYLPEETEIIGNKAKARKGIKTGNWDMFYKLVEEGKIKNTKQFVQESFLSPAQRAFKRLSAQKKYELWKEMTKEQKEQFYHLLPKKK